MSSNIALYGIQAIIAMCALIVVYVLILKSGACNRLRPGWASKENVKGVTGVDVHGDVELQAATTVPSYGAASTATIHAQQHRHGHAEELPSPPPTYQRAMEDRAVGPTSA